MFQVSAVLSELISALFGALLEIGRRTTESRWRPSDARPDLRIPSPVAALCKVTRVHCRMQSADGGIFALRARLMCKGVAYAKSHSCRGHRAAAAMHRK